MLNNTKIKFERIYKEIYQFDNLKARLILKSFCTYLIYYYLRNLIRKDTYKTYTLLTNMQVS